MLPCKVTSLTAWFGMLSTLALLDATEVSSMVTNGLLTSTNTVSSNASELSDKSAHSPENISHLPSSALPSQTTFMGMTTEALVTSEKSISSETLSPQYSTGSTQVTTITEGFTLHSETKLDAIFKSTTHNSQSPSSATGRYSSTTDPHTVNAEKEEAKEQAAPKKTVKCTSLRDLISTSKVICFKYSENTTCDMLEEEKKSELLSYLCKVINKTECHITIHHSEVERGCILWVPTSQAAEDRLMDESSTEVKYFISKTLGQISDHQTRSQKTMIALVTCGVLMAFFILTGYFLSNRESWSPGRERLGEDPYYNETESQGNTLVSVSTNNQDKPNSDTKENGTGQTVTPAATNGHTNKKQNVSDTEL